MKTILAAAFLAGSAFAPALALPFNQPANGATEVIQIAGGCGAGWHRGPNGGCLRNFADPGAHACPRGYHIGPGGACRGNGR